MGVPGIRSDRLAAVADESGFPSPTAAAVAIAIAAFVVVFLFLLLFEFVPVLVIEIRNRLRRLKGPSATECQDVKTTHKNFVTGFAIILCHQSLRQHYDTYYGSELVAIYSGFILFFSLSLQRLRFAPSVTVTRISFRIPILIKMTGVESPGDTPYIY